MVILAGIDEAGLGPALGPLCIGCTALRMPDGSRADTPWIALAQCVAREAKRGDERLLVADSKVVHARRKRPGLERATLEFFSLWLGEEPFPKDRESFLAHLGASEALAGLPFYPWYDGGRWALPVDGTTDELKRRVDDLRAGCCEGGVAVASLRLRVVLAGLLNRRFDDGLNKSEALILETGTLLRELSLEFPDEALDVIVDRQGGRADYLPMLCDLFPGAWLDTLAKDEGNSEYRVHRGDSPPMTVRFLAKADGSAFCVALASCLAKYVRERFMEDLNGFFADRVKDLRPTAGYHGDAKRYLEAIRPVMEKEKLDWRLLLRER